MIYIPPELLTSRQVLVINIESLLSSLEFILYNVNGTVSDVNFNPLFSSYIFNKTSHGYGYVSEDDIRIGLKAEDWSIDVLENVLSEMTMEIAYELSDVRINPWGMYYTNLDGCYLHIEYLCDYRILRWINSDDSKQFSKEDTLKNLHIGGF